MIKIKRFEINPFSQNTYLLSQNKKAILIDAGFYSKAEFDDFFDYLKSEDVELSAILLTHAHIDHVLGLNTILKQYSIPVYLHPDDVELLDQVHQQGQLFGFNIEPIKVKTIDLLEQENFELYGFDFTVLFTPGHAPGHLSFYLKQEETVISGDVLFAGSVGRTDLYKGDFDLLAKSIREKLYTLPDNTKVLPGHGPETTIRREKLSNPFVKAKL